MPFRLRQGYIAALGLAMAATGCAMSTEDEVALGSQYAAEINRQLPLVTDPAITGYLTRLGESIAQVGDDRGLRWHFHMVNSMDINAFAVPGGYIYINRGLVERARTMSQVAGVLGHEVAHVTMRHTAKRIQKAQQTNVLVGVGCALTRMCRTEAEQVLINLGAGAAFAKFSRDDEREADREGVRYMIRSGIDPDGIPQMFEILLEERRSRPAGVETWFLSHPLEEERVAQARGLIAQYDPGVVRGLRTDTPDFQTFKRRVAALPPPPEPARR